MTAGALPLAAAGQPSSAAKHTLHKPTHPALHPCAGKGLADSKREASFAKGMKALQRNWENLTPLQRQQSLGDLVNTELGKSGVPKVGINPKQSLSGTTTNGQLDFLTWNLDVNPDLMESNALTNDQTKQLGDTTYHESRHAEQWYLMARKQAAEGQTAQQINQDTLIPADVTKTAVQNPMTKNDPMAGCAEQMHDSVYGTGGAVGTLLGK